MHTYGATVTVIDQIERMLDEVIACASVEKLCTQYIFQLSQILRSAPPSDLKTLITNYQTACRHDQTAYRKR